MNFNKIFCLFGKHQQSKNSIELKLEKNSVMRMELFFCIHCKKILFIEYQPSALFNDVKSNKVPISFNPTGKTSWIYKHWRQIMEVCELEEGKNAEK